MSATATHDRDVLVIGGGQAGLAIGYHLAERGSALLGWIKDDARHIADEIGAFATDRSTHRSSPAAALPEGAPL